MKNIYLCGPTVYDYQHLGNMRPVIITDFLIRSYLSLGEKINYVHNITDIDDKIITKSINVGVSEEEISKKYTDYYLMILNKINIIMPNEMPKVTDNIDPIIKFIAKLIKNNAAYVKDGDVYFDIHSTKGYGSVSNYKISNNIYETINDKKRNQEDFALWKTTKIGVTWDSPWSKGRPGWHTECSVFIEKYFNRKTIDIHGGGIDLKFPHHENENIQYLAANHVPITKEWYHFGHLFLDNQKMSKSLNNILRVDEFISKYNPNILRLLFILTNPKAPMSINNELINDAIKLNKKLEYIWNSHKKLDGLFKNRIFEKYIIEMKFSNALFYLHETFKQSKFNDFSSIQSILRIIDLLGLKYERNEKSKEIEILLDHWEKLKKAKNFEKADEIREKIKKMNINP